MAGIKQHQFCHQTLVTKKCSKKSNQCVGFCVKLYLCNSLFILLIFLALLIGYWVSFDASIMGNLSNQTSVKFL